MLWLCVSLPELALEVASRAADPDEALTIAQGEGREQRVVAANECARRTGVRPGLRVSEAHALAPSLRVQPRDVAAEQEALARLAAWSGQYTSFVSVVEPNALLLEIEGSLKLYRGLDRLIDNVREGLQRLGYSARLAVAPTPLGAAWLARSGIEARVTDYGSLFGALAPLPLACLELDPDREALLRGLGLATLLDCLRLPRDGIARRVGPQILDRLDRAFGRKPDPRPAFAAPESFRARIGFPAPVATCEALLFPLHRLLLELCGFLLARGRGAAALDITLRSARALSTPVPIRLVAPSRDPQHLIDLVRERLERVVLPAPVEEVLLEVDALAPLAPQPYDFFKGAKTSEELRAQILERLQARLGREAVRGIATQADHRPERAWRDVEPGTAADAPAAGRRPMWLLPEPMVLEAHGDQPYWGGPLVLEPEQERIESGWWDGAEVARDYFTARDARGRRVWIFRELAPPRRWFLHGVFG